MKTVKNQKGTETNMTLNMTLNKNIEKEKKVEKTFYLYVIYDKLAEQRYYTFESDGNINAIRIFTQHMQPKLDKNEYALLKIGEMVDKTLIGKIYEQKTLIKEGSTLKYEQ